MATTMSRRKDTKRMDGLVALPLARFRRVLTELTPAELEALEARIALQSVKSRWARGSHGVARHQAVNDLGLLARRAAEARRERETRLGALTQLRLVETPLSVREFPTPDPDLQEQDRAA